MISKLTYKLLLLAVLFSAVFITGCQNKKDMNKVKIPRLDPKYNYKDKEPMGAYIAHNYISSLFNKGITKQTDKSFSNLRYQINYNQSLYFILSKGVFLNNDDVESMMNYVSNGNILFISAEYIDEKLVDTLGVKMNSDFIGFYGIDDYDIEKKDTWVSLIHDLPSQKNKYSFYYIPFESRFVKYDTLATQVLGYNETGFPNFIVVNHGLGKFIFHSSPYTFSNYFLLTKNNRQYLEKVFSYIDPDINNVYWDDFYRSRKSSDDQFSIVGFFKKHPPLYYAFLIVLGALLVFLAFGGKRRQRIIPERFPPVNTTKSYTETIGRLYLQRKDNRNIAIKMFAFFLDHVRNSFYLNTQTLNNEFASALSRKSGVPENKVLHLLQLMDETEREEDISDSCLLEIHNLLQDYFKK